MKDAFTTLCTMFIMHLNGRIEILKKRQGSSEMSEIHLAVDHDSVTLNIVIKRLLYGGVLLSAQMLGLNINAHNLQYGLGNIRTLSFISVRNHFQKTKG